MGVRFVYHEFRRTAKLWKKWKICFKPQLWMWLVDLSHNFECDWLIELTGNNLASEFAKSSSKRTFWIWFLFKDKYISVIFVLGLEDFPFWFGDKERKTEYRRFCVPGEKKFAPLFIPSLLFFLSFAFHFSLARATIMQDRNPATCPIKLPWNYVSPNITDTVHGERLLRSSRR